MGSVNFGAWAYVRYLNQNALENSYTDSFDRTYKINRRNDFQFNKVNLTFNGWLFDQDFRYLLYTWTNNTSQGEGAQVVVAGNFKYRFNKAVDVGVGIDALPGTRSLYGNFPYFNKVDMRTMADEFFRPSYTTGIWSAGELDKGLTYKLMLGNNLSQLGVNATRLDGALNTWSGRIQWQPTTGEFGPEAVGGTLRCMSIWPPSSAYRPPTAERIARASLAPRMSIIPRYDCLTERCYSNPAHSLPKGVLTARPIRWCRRTRGSSTRVLS